MFEGQRARLYFHTALMRRPAAQGQFASSLFEQVAFATQHAGIVVGITAVEYQRGVIGNITADGAGGTAIADTQGTGINGGQATVAGIPRQGQHAVTHFKQAAAVGYRTGIGSISRRIVELQLGPIGQAHFTAGTGQVMGGLVVTIQVQ
ncbi:hypothetical protein SRDD_01800 [Serratia sp. DD3]|nr:hypothetical protein SRDD_01800 [Serratia sp. DD3]